MSFNAKSTLRRLGRAFRAKDEAAFDTAIEELEEGLEDKSRDEEEPALEVHNHIPDYQRDTSLGEVPPKDPAHDSEEPPPWFKKHQEANDAAMKSMRDGIEALQKWAKEEAKEPEHQEDRHHDEDPEDEPRDGEPNLEMDRHRDNEREEEEAGDRRRNNDESNREILGELEFEAPPGTGDKARKARDSRYLEEAFGDCTAKAEVLAPGIRLPTFDRAAPPARTYRAMAGLRRTALDLAYNKADTRGIISDAMSGRALDSRRMSLANTRVLFNSVASAVAASNNQRATDRSTQFSPGGGHSVGGGRVNSVADINKINREKYTRS